MDFTVQQNGLPQGSVLSVTLFLLAINDLAKNVKSPVHVLGYADDWYLVMSHKKTKCIEKTLQKSINSVLKWASKVGFKFSPSKTTLIHFCRKNSCRRSREDPSLFMHGEQVKTVDEMRVLGVTFDRKMTWELYIKEITSRCKKRLNIMRAISGTKWGADEKTMLMLYQASVLSVLEYGSEVYSSACKTSLGKLNSIHNVGLRLATGAFRMCDTESLYVYTGITSLQQRREQRILNHATKISCLSNHPLNGELRTTNSTNPNQVNCRYQSFVQRARTIASSYDLDFTTLKMLKNPSRPPWTLHEVNINTELTVYLQ